MFELRLKKFVNNFGKDAQGHCCSGYRNRAMECTGTCKTRFRVCLKHYQVEVSPNPPCTFGDQMTPVLGENTMDLQDTAFRFPFEISWPVSFFHI